METRMLFPDFADKIVLIYLMRRSPDDGGLLERAVFEDQGGRAVLVGDFAEGASANDWVAGGRTALAWDSAQQYVIFDSMADDMARASRAFTNEQYH